MARLRLSPEEERQFVLQLGRIVAYIDQLKDYPTTAVAGLGQGSPEAEDRVAPCLPRAFFLANAPATFDEFLLVPQVKGGDDG